MSKKELLLNKLGHGIFTNKEINKKRDKFVDDMLEIIINYFKENEYDMNSAEIYDINIIYCEAIIQLLLGHASFMKISAEELIDEINLICKNYKKPKKIKKILN